MSDRLFRRAKRQETRNTLRGRFQPRLDFLEERQVLNASLASLSNISALQYQGYQVPLDGSGSAATQQTYTVTSSNPDIGATVATGEFLTINVSHTSSGAAGDPTFSGSIVLQLFGDLTPTSVAQIESFVTQGFYNGKNFPRIVSGFPDSNGFILQAGSVNSDGSGTSPFPNFNNEIVQQLAFTNPGQLALANSGGGNTDNSQFFITTGAPAFLDGSYTVLGQVVSGMNLVNEMSQVATENSSVYAFGSPPVAEKSFPVSPVNISSATLSTTNPDGVVHIDTTQAQVGETSTITVTAHDPSTSTTAVQTFQVAVVANPNVSTLPNSLKPIAYSASRLYTANTAETIQLGGDPANDGANGNQTLTYAITFQPINGKISNFNKNTGSLTYTPNAGSTGPDTFQFTVTNSGAGLTSNPATVTLTTTSTQTPTAMPISQISFVGSPTTIQLMGTSPVSGQALTYSILVAPTQGTLSAPTATGSVVYTPMAGASGTDSFQYVVTNTGPPAAGLASQPATVTINLKSLPTTPPATTPPATTPPATTPPAATPPVTTPPVTTPPAPVPLVTVQSVKLGTLKLSKKKTIKVVVVTFSGALEQGAAQNVSNYQLAMLVKTKKLGLHATKAIAFTGAVYSASANTVTLTPRGTLPAQLVQLTIKAAGTLDAEGRPIDGTRSGQPGGNYVTSFKG